MAAKEVATQAAMAYFTGGASLAAGGMGGATEGSASPVQTSRSGDIGGATMGNFGGLSFGPSGRSSSGGINNTTLMVLGIAAALAVVLVFVRRR